MRGAVRVRAPGLIVAAGAAIALVAFFLFERDAAAAAPVLLAPQSQTLVQPAQTFKDCQRIKRCAARRCVAHWRCRECDYKRVCRQGRCEWIDVCVWGPYRLVLPRGALPPG